MPPNPQLMNKRHKPRHEFIPAPSSGAHCILVGMFKAEQNELVRTLSKHQVLDFAIKYANSNLSDKSKIWASMKGLVDKRLVDRQISRDPLYYLLDDGRNLAVKLIALQDGTPSCARNTHTQSCLATRHSETSRSGLAQSALHSAKFEPFTLQSGTFDVVLIIDQREKMEIHQLDPKIKYETRTLACGDFLWIAKPKNIQSNDRTKDLVLDYIVERKRLDDLLSSLFDGRFEQQKLRLKNSGIRRPCYLIEDCGKLRESRLTATNLNQAITSIEIHDNITVERVRNQASSLDYLVRMTRCIEKFLSTRKFDLIASTVDRLNSGDAKENEFTTFSEFQTKGAKITNWTVREMFAKHLIQIAGMSDKKISAILESYPTFSSLIDNYESCDTEKARETLLSKLQIPGANRSIGPVLSKRVYCNYEKPIKDY